MSSQSYGSKGFKGSKWSKESKGSKEGLKVKGSRHLSGLKGGRVFRGRNGLSTTKRVLKGIKGPKYPNMISVSKWSRVFKGSYKVQMVSKRYVAIVCN